ncbi:tetratricopeptide (TPR) repeat protein [Allocatelliglobosispora scoriae]|uniref:Tetratricopeptide (TPR) repeat protein n=2 Tax=Allocatelliglobosispora scoriae TaxID=643052 RepID=A0A841C2A1_9ACTN|nr:tetratricopeptide (TPR) repeat protein [Allocatelliglobosispora scoriae]
MSLRQLGTVVPADYGQLSKIENGKARPSEAMIRAIDMALNANGELVTIMKREAAARQTKVASQNMKRRTLVAGAAGSALVSLIPGITPGTRLGISDVERLTQRADRLYAMDYLHGSESLWQAAIGYAQEAYGWLDHMSYSSTVGDRLMEAVSRMQMCAGWLAADAGHLDVARACLHEALGIARQADDPEVEYHALSDLALQANMAGNPHQARRWAEAADRAASATDRYTRLRILIQLRLARAGALAGEPADSDRAMAAARNIFDAESEREPDAWTLFVSPAELDGMEGTCALDLGDNRRAVDLLARAIAGYGDGYTRTRAIYRARIARAHLGATRDVEQAADAAQKALDDMGSTVTSWRLSRELDLTAAQLRPHRREHAAAEFLARHAVRA